MNILKFFLVFILVFSVNFGFSYASESTMLLENEKNTINVFDESVKSVVHISNIRIARTGWFDQEAMEIPTGAGSGFVWDDSGHIVTNYHVISNGDSFTVRFHKDPKEYQAKFVGGEPKKDIAVLKLIDFPKKLYPIKIGTSNNLRVGQKALAIGNPFGLDHTITTGIISALERKIQGFGNVKIYGMIQTDCSINPGNSGGPLLSSSGNLIGMNTMIYSPSGSSAGVGFAVPVDTINRYASQIIKYGKVTRPGLGVGIFSQYYNSYFGIEEGIIVKSVVPGSPAEAAGIEGLKINKMREYKLGDVIQSIDGKKVNSFDDIYNVLGDYKAGESVQVGILRDGKTIQLKIKLMSVDQ